MVSRLPMTDRTDSIALGPEVDADSAFAILLKFSQYEYLEDFRNGLIYMNPQRYFAGLEKIDPVRGDKFEGSDRVYQAADIKEFRVTDNISGSEMKLGPEHFVNQIIISFGRQPYNLFCLHSITEVPGDDSVLIDQRNAGFGDHFTVVTDTQELLDRVSNSAKQDGLNIECNHVEYHDHGSYSGDTGPFWKPDALSYQREFRIVVFPGQPGAIRISVGTLKDITTPIYPSADINKLVDFSILPNP